MEILSPAGSIESVKAAVMSGADAVYLGFGDFNARRNAKNFTLEQLHEACDLCNQHNVKIYITLNILLNDRELKNAVDFIKLISTLNITAVIVQDLGVLQLIRKISPNLPVHASTQLTVHNLAGVKKAKELGFTRVVLSRELSYENIKYIAENTDVELEVFVHGALCMCYSGQCYLSSMIGSRSGNRGLCAQPCRLPYSYEGKKATYPLSLKDLSLINHVAKLKELGIACLKIEGRMKRPEYTAVVTKIYKTIATENRLPTTKEIDLLQTIFSRNGFTEGYFNGKLGNSMFGVKSDGDTASLNTLYEKITSEYKNSDIKYPVDFEFLCKEGCSISLKATTEFASISATGVVPEIAQNRPTDTTQVETLLSKTGGTIFDVSSISCQIDDGLMVRAKDINALRREVLEQLADIKMHKFDYPTFDYEFAPKIKNKKYLPKFTVEVTKISQISDSMYSNKPEMLYIPLKEICQNKNFITNLLNDGFKICVKVPKIVTDNEYNSFNSMLDVCKKIGVKYALVSNIGMLDLDFEIIGDYSLNIYNSTSLSTMSNIKCQTLSFELKTSQIRDISKCMNTELLIYGYLPLMIFENCLIKNRTGACSCEKEVTYLTDRKNEKFALMPEFGCRNTLLNSKPLYVLDKFADFTSIGVNNFRLLFTIEDTKTVDNIYKSHILNKKIDLDFTRGLYYRGTL